MPTTTTATQSAKPVTRKRQTFVLAEGETLVVVHRPPPEETKKALKRIAARIKRNPDGDVMKFLNEFRDNPRGS